MNSSKTILAVDDSPSIRQMIAFTARSAGYNVIEALDGTDALDKARQHDVHLVLTDQNMPKMDGLTLVSQLRMLPQYANVPILILTTEDGDDMKQRGREARATGWLVKPFDPETLLSVIGKVINR